MSKLTIAKTSTGTIRCMGRLSCDCRARIQAIDMQLDENDDGLAGLRLVCPNCHQDLIEVSPC
jgi:hypothetical protein